MIAYRINGTTADMAEMNIGQARANELAAQGWLVVEEPIMWTAKQYVNGVVIDKPLPEPPMPYVLTDEELKQQSNASTLAAISAIEMSLIRPMRELLSTEVADKSFAQAKINEVERQIAALRLQLQ